MEIAKLIDNYGDDIFALALIITKDFNSAKQVFIKTASDYDRFSEDCGIYDFAKRVYAECAEVDSNEGAVTLTGIELDSKRRQLFEEVLSKGEMVRTVAHLFYENDLDTKQISDLTGKPEDYITSLFDELPCEALEKNYKDICTKIRAEDKLKAYVIRSVTTGSGRRFEVKQDAVPLHTWKPWQKIVVVIIAIIITIVACIVIPILQGYMGMLESEASMSSWQEVSDGESFTYTYEAHSESKN